MLPLSLKGVGYLMQGIVGSIYKQVKLKQDFNFIGSVTYEIFYPFLDWEKTVASKTESEFAIAKTLISKPLK